MAHIPLIVVVPQHLHAIQKGDQCIKHIGNDIELSRCSDLPAILHHSELGSLCAALFCPQFAR